MEDGHRQVSIELRYVGCGERAVQRGRLQQYRRTTFGGTIFYADLLTCGAGGAAAGACVYGVRFAGEVR